MFRYVVWDGITDGKLIAKLAESHRFFPKGLFQAGIREEMHIAK